MTQCVVRFAKKNLELLSGHRVALSLLVFFHFFYTALLNPDNPGRLCCRDYQHNNEQIFRASVGGEEGEAERMYADRISKSRFAEDREVATELRGTILSSSLSGCVSSDSLRKDNASERASEIKGKEGRDRTLGLEGLSC